MNDEWTPVLVDDPAPPEPDSAVLARVVRRGRQRLIRRHAIFGGAAVVALVLVGSGVAVANNNPHRSRVRIETPAPTTTPAPIRTEQQGAVVPKNPAFGERWFAFAASDDGQRADIYLVRGGEAPRRVELPGSATHHEVCPAFAPQTATSAAGEQRLVFGRATRTFETEPDRIRDRDAELLIVTVAADGSVTPQTTIPLEGMHTEPCAIWAPDGRWVALAGADDQGVADGVWVVDTVTGEIRRLPGHPTDLEWRPGTDELAITGAENAHGESDAPVDIYTVSTGEIRSLGAARALELTWSPDGTTLAFTGDGQPGISLVDADGTHERHLTEQLDASAHGTGVTWSPDGRSIAYLRGIDCCERAEVVLVSASAAETVRPGTETVIAPLRTGTGNQWYPFRVVWSPDATHLMYFAWGPGNDLIAVPVDASRSPIVITGDSSIDVKHGTRWVPLQPWSHT